jgi:glycosyltransferase involved in cell wall biosynthesis
MSKPLRITFVLASADLAGGVRTVAMHARLLQARGHQVTVISAPPPAPTLRERVRSVIRRRGWLSRPTPRPSHLDGGEVVHRRLDRFRPLTDADVPDADVIVATWWLTAEWIARLSPRKGAKAHFVQGHDLLYPGAPVERIVATWHLPFHRIVCSRWLTGLAETHYGDMATSYVPNGVDLDQFTAPPRGRQVHPTVGFIYGELPIKGCDVAIDAFARAAKRVPDLKLLAFGMERPRAETGFPADARFHLYPSQQEIPNIYASCDAWIWPSHQEGFGLPILEAMACRTPVIATPAGAAPEILAHGGGILLPASEPAAMAQAIEQICRLPGPAWSALSERARETAARYSWPRASRLFEEALETAIRRSPR